MISDAGLAREAARLLRELLQRLDARPQTPPFVRTFVRSSAERILADVEELARLVTPAACGGAAPEAKMDASPRSEPPCRPPTAPTPGCSPT